MFPSILIFALEKIYRTTIKNLKNQVKKNLVFKNCGGSDMIHL